MQETKDILGTLKKLTDWLYEQRLGSGNQQYSDSWSSFFKSMPTLPKDINTVEQELALNYHRQRWDDLRQDIQTQAVRSEPLVVQSSPAPASQGASSFVTPAVQRVQEPVVAQESLGGNSHSMIRSEIQSSRERENNRLVPQISNNSAHMQKTYCPYFSRTAVIGFSVLVAGVALEAGRRYYSKF